MGLIPLLIVAALSAAIFPVIIAIWLRDLFRRFPEAQMGFVAGGWWISMSRRFGLPYGVTAILLSFAWLVIGMNIVPDTDLGGVLLFGPCLHLMATGICLFALRVARWMADER